MAEGALRRADQHLEPRAPREQDLARSPASRHYVKLSCLIALTDALAVVAAILITRYVRWGARPAGPHFATILLVAPLVVIPTFAAFRLYSFSRLSPAEEFRRLFEASGVL